MRSIRNTKAVIFFTFALLFISCEGFSKDIEEIAKQLKEIMPAEMEAAVSSSPIPGLLQVVVDSNVFYVSEDLKFLVRGELIDLRNKVNMTENIRRELRAEILKEVSKEDVISFYSKKTPVVDEIFVFTDIDCTYCRKFHLEVPELNSAGISVHYLAFPRKGIKSVSSSKAQSAWCATNSSKALTEAKLGKEIPSKKCLNPVKKQFDLGIKIGVMGTPAIYASNGEELGGYLSAQDVLRKITN